MSKHAEQAAKTFSDPRWAAVVARDSRADGQFFYSVFGCMDTHIADR
ncbi:hypothetical protein GALL_82270 [mine drainage metagenome]|uniref:Ada DNA repair metal-binding domain-containing protein n=1 Tax=mine drainage metagenome TaxID=410659 RepID=A0A1J5T0P9_9ZZZZ